MTEVADNTLVDSRYRILRRLGSGGMADVYSPRTPTSAARWR